MSKGEEQLGESFLEYSFPPRGAHAELVSLKAHASKMITGYRELDFHNLVYLIGEKRDEAIERESGVPGGQPLLMTLEKELKDPLDWNNIRENIEEAIDDINLDASPGIPMLQFGATNGIVLEREKLRVIQMVQERIERMCLVANVNGYRDIVKSVKDGLLDPCRIFIKNEPHKNSKIKEGRYRLIWSLSLLDQIVDRVLFSEICEDEIQKFQRLVSKGGAGLSTDEQQVQLFHNIKTLLGDEFWTNDMKNWDWSFKDWQYEAFWIKCAFRLGYSTRVIVHHLRTLKSQSMNADTLGQLIEFNFSNIPLTLKCMWIRLYFMARVPIVTSNGQILEHGPPGIMKSGLYITLAANSFNRGLLASIITKGGAIAMGDDCGESISKDEYLLSGDIEERYKSFGFTTTDLEFIQNPDEQGFEFCSHRLYPTKAIPLNEVKIVLKHLVSKLRTKREQQFQLQNDIRHARNRDLFLEFLRPRWEAWIKDDEESKEYFEENQEDRADSSSSSKRCKEDRESS